MATTRRAEATWQGDLFNGRGAVTTKSSGLFHDAAVTWAARTESSNGKTSPEELLAAAHASCFSMALANGLSKAGTPATRLEVAAVVTFDKTPAGFRVTASALEVKGTVPGVDLMQFEKAATEAKDGCPISQALKGNVEITVRVALA